MPVAASIAATAKLQSKTIDLGSMDTEIVDIDVTIFRDPAEQARAANMARMGFLEVCEAVAVVKANGGVDAGIVAALEGRAEGICRLIAMRRYEDAYTGAMAVLHSCYRGLTPVTVVPYIVTTVNLAEKAAQGDFSVSAEDVQKDMGVLGESGVLELHELAGTSLGTILGDDEGAEEAAYDFTHVHAEESMGLSALH